MYIDNFFGEGIKDDTNRVRSDAQLIESRQLRMITVNARSLRP